jgi:hypothetical protein
MTTNQSYIHSASDIEEGDTVVTRNGNHYVVDYAPGTVHRYMPDHTTNTAYRVFTASKLGDSAIDIVPHRGYFRKSSYNRDIRDPSPEDVVLVVKTSLGLKSNSPTLLPFPEREVSRGH